MPSPTEARELPLSEERFRLFLEAVKDYAIYTLSADGRVTSWNQGAERLKGYSAAEILGQHFSIFFSPEDQLERKPELELQIASEVGRFETDGWRVRKGGSRFWANVVLTVIKDDDGKVLGFVKVTRDFTERMHAAQRLRRANEELALQVAQRKAAEEVARASYEREAELRQGEERFRLFMETVRDYAIYTLDPDGRVTSWNQGAERIKGYTAAEIIGTHFSCFFGPEDIREGKPQEELEVAARDGRFEAEAWRVRKGGSRFWANVVLTAIKDEHGQLIGFVKVTRDFTERMHAQLALERANRELAAEVAERKAAEKKLAASEQSLRELSLNLLRSQDEERRRIGRELHDSLGQYLAMLKMHLDSLQLSEEGQAENLHHQIQQCVALADSCIKEVRTISYLLYPPMLEEVGLQSAISWFLDGFSKRSGIHGEFQVSPEFGRLDRDVELALFRVLQESLTNVHRHSGSSVAHILLAKGNGGVCLQIRDEGKGIPPELLRERMGGSVGSLGVGLRGMHERVQQLGGALEIHSDAHGTTVTATVPAERLLTAIGRTA